MRPIEDHRTKLDEAAREALLRRYAAHGRARDLERLVVSYQPLALSLARRYSPGKVPDPDLEQAACEGLVKAVTRFDPTRGVAFTSFALPTILGELRRYLRDTTWTVHVPRRLKERARTLAIARERMSTQRGRSPSASELAEDLGWTLEEVVEALSVNAARVSISLEAPRDIQDDVSLVERLGVTDPAFERVEWADAVACAAPSLSSEEQTVISLSFGADLTQREIAKRLGCSRSHVGRVLHSGLDRLRAEAA